MVHPIFENWQDYEGLKDPEEHMFISYTEKWEIKYLLKKIKRHYHNLPAREILDAIEYCGRTIPLPHTRKEFMIAVMNELGFKIR
ncbi:MAG: hypothetical protein ABIQ40_04755 [Bacteroidia bacterium]